MKKTIFLFAAIMALSVRQASSATTLDAGQLKVEIDDSGKIIHLYDTLNKRDYINSSLPTYLIQIKRYADNKLSHPQSVKFKTIGKNALSLKVTFDKGTELLLIIIRHSGWLHMELKKATALKEIEAIRWGPINTNILGPVGGFFGVIHGGKATLGMMSLEPNTDGSSMNGNGAVNPRTTSSNCAGWLNIAHKGTYLLLDAVDHTRSRSIEKHRKSVPINRSVLGSKVALYLAPKGKELDLIEKIVKTEGLPYLTLNGVWNKKAPRMRSPSVWGGYGEKNVLKYMDLCKSFDGNVISSFSRMFGNWGHFAIDPKLYSSVEAVKKASSKCLENGIHMNMHTLSNFIKPINIPEPFITPTPDPRLAKYDFTSSLGKNVDDKTASIILKQTQGLADFLKKNAGKNSRDAKVLLKLDNELVFFGKIEMKNGETLLSKCERGYLMSDKGSHKAGTKAEFLFFSGYSCVFAGTMPMLMEVATNLGKRVKTCAIGKVSLDGHESASNATGHGLYAMNMVLKTIYGFNNDREMIFTGSCMTNYCWYMMGYISWGEYDLKKGFRGTMLDYRIRRQIQLENSLMPHKLGQHYPKKDTTLEDINWLMGQAVGWNAGVELSINLTDFQQNPHKNEIIALVRKWEKIRRSGKVTELQKLQLRQVDRVYTMKKQQNAWQLVPLQKHWQDPRCEILPPSSIKVENLSGSAKATKPKVDISIMHNPLIFQQAALSYDIPLRADEKNKWRITWPEKNNSDQLKLAIRVPRKSPCGIKNIWIKMKGRRPIMIPVEIKPGQHIASPLNAPMFFLYDSNNNVLKGVQPCYATALPSLGNNNTAELECSFEPSIPGKKPVALMNTLFSKWIK